ncbi:MAG: AMP-binding protein [Pseudomonadota bacterium]
MLPPDIDSFAALRDGFQWHIPERFNIAEACAARHASAAPDAIALILDQGSDQNPQKMTWQQLDQCAQKCAALLAGFGVARGDRVAIQLPQGWQAVAIHLAAYRLGAIAVPLATQFGPQAIGYRIAKARPKIFVATSEALARWRQSEIAPPRETIALCVDGAAPDALEFDPAFEAAKPLATIADTGPDDPAMMLFTSGTTGQPNGVLHGHRVLLGHLPGIQLAQELMPQQGDVFWTPSDWAWAGGLLNALLPALYFQVPVVAANAPRFSASWALDVMARHRVTNAFMPPTAIRMIAAHQGKTPDLHLRAVGAAGEQLGAKAHAAATHRLGAPVNEFYGQTECNAIIGSCARLGISNPASMGQQVPGHTVRLRTQDGKIVEHGEGEIIIDARSPVALIGYFEDAAASAEKIVDGWIRTGDLASLSKEGWFTFKSRNDDIITSAGYRIGPAEIEECLRSHDHVIEAAVVGLADAERTQTVAAFVTVTDAGKKIVDLESALKAHVRDRLSAHLYPRHVEIVDRIPVTESGKIMRRLFRDRT